MLVWRRRPGGVPGSANGPAVQPIAER